MFSFMRFFSSALFEETLIFVTNLGALHITARRIDEVSQMSLLILEILSIRKIGEALRSHLADGIRRADEARRSVAEFRLIGKSIGEVREKRELKVQFSAKRS